MDMGSLEHRDYATLQDILKSMNVVDIARDLEGMEEKETILIFRMLPKDVAADAFAYLQSDTQEKIITAIQDHEIRDIIDELFVDDAVDFIEEMPASVVKRVLQNVPDGKRQIINQFLKYPEDSAGSIMTIEYIAIKEAFTVRETFDLIRKRGVDKETIYTCYVVDQNRKLTGAVSVRTLLLRELGDRIGDIMDTVIISAKTDDDKEALSNNFRKYDLLAMPVVDHENRLVGIVTVDDVMDVQEEEATEDFEIMAAISPTENPYLKTGVWTMTRHRLPWLLLLMLSATVTGSIITGFEKSLAALPILVAFIPMLMDTGGNSGAQSSTMIIRGMALEEIQLTDALRVWWKEIRISVICGSTLSAVNFVRILVTGGQFRIALTVSITLVCTVVLAKSVGCLLPMGAKKLKLDPAVMASPAITTIVDAGALMVFFGLSKAILGI